MPAANGEDGGASLPTADRLERLVSGSRKSSVYDVDGSGAVIPVGTKRVNKPLAIGLLEQCR